MSAHEITSDHRLNRMLYRLDRERVLTRTQLHHVRGTNELIALMVERGWLAPAPALEPDANGVLRVRERFEFTIAGHYARQERVANGNYATC
jgi:hypothetical protein